MDRKETLEEFYAKRYNDIPLSLPKEIDHFNIFPLTTRKKDETRQLPYRRRDYYKVMFVLGEVGFHYADKSVRIKKPSLVFSNPFIPYNCEDLHLVKGGKYCIFNDAFFQNYGSITKYSVYQPTGNHVFSLLDLDLEYVKNVFEKIQTEFDSEYEHKYDVIRNHILELLHFAMKMEPHKTINHGSQNAAQRITTLFLVLLERQFPIDDNHPSISYKSPSEFAHQLNVHVNHLNRSVKNVLRKSTSQVIADRLIQEAKYLLKHSSWNVSEVSYALGFSEPSHFNHFFKKYLNSTPSQYRESDRQ